MCNNTKTKRMRLNAGADPEFGKWAHQHMEQGSGGEGGGGGGGGLEERGGWGAC